MCYSENPLHIMSKFITSLIKPKSFNHSINHWLRSTIGWFSIQFDCLLVFIQWFVFVNRFIPVWRAYSLPLLFQAFLWIHWMFCMYLGCTTSPMIDTKDYDAWLICMFYLFTESEIIFLEMDRFSSEIIFGSPYLLRMDKIYVTNQ